MAKLTQLLKENIDQRKRKVYLKAVIDMATAYSRRGYTQDEAIKDAAKGIENVYGYVLTPQDIEAVRHFVPENPQFKEIVVKPTHNFEFKIGDLVRYEDEGVFGELGVLTVLNRVESWDAVPAHNPEGVNLDHIDPEEFESSNWYLLDMGGGRKTWEAADYLEPISSDLEEIVVKPTDPTKKLKQALVDAMYDDCWNFSDGDFDDWFENGFDNGDSPEVEEAYFALQEVAPKEAPDFYYDEAPYIVEKMLKDED